MRMTKTIATRVARSRGLKVASGVSGENAALRVYKKYLPQIQKRSGAIVPFEFPKIVSAIEKSMKASNEGSGDEAVVIAHKVAGARMRTARTSKKIFYT